MIKNIFKTKKLINLMTKSPHFPLRGKEGKLGKKKIVLCWSI